MAVYILHFSEPFKHATHYIGWTRSVRTVEQRLNHHMRGEGARLMAAVAKAGIRVFVSRVFRDGDRNFERNLKNKKNGARFCPWCTDRKKWRKNGRPIPAELTLYARHAAVSADTVRAA